MAESTFTGTIATGSMSATWQATAELRWERRQIFAGSGATKTVRVESFLQQKWVEWRDRHDPRPDWPAEEWRDVPTVEPTRNL